METSDANNDFRQVENLPVFFQNHGRRKKMVR